MDAGDGMNGVGTAEGRGGHFGETDVANLALSDRGLASYMEEN